MKDYYRIILGQKNSEAGNAYQGGYIGGNFGIEEDLSVKLPENWKDFNKKFIPKFLKQYPEKSKVAAGLACGMLHTISKGIKIGDIVISPDGDGSYFVGEVIGEYRYDKGNDLPHQREVMWFKDRIIRSEMTQALQNSTGSVGTVSRITKYASELEQLIQGISPNVIISTDSSVEDPTEFALEKHLEDFLVKNWSKTELSKEYDIYMDDDQIVGQQFPTDTGPIDILAISKDQKRLLVVELKKGRASDSVVGQIQRYMGYVQYELAEENQVVEGIIIALEDDIKIQRALSISSNIKFYRYEISFKLKEVN